MEPDNFTLTDFFLALKDWSESTFGPAESRGPVGPLKHLEKEAKEAYEETDKAKQLIEIGDCLFLTFDAAWRAGLTADQLVEICFAKLAKNKLRTWPAPSPDGAVEHVRGSHD